MLQLQPIAKTPYWLTASLRPFPTQLLHAPDIRNVSPKETIGVLAAHQLFRDPSLAMISNGQLAAMPQIFCYVRNGAVPY